jgi:hypothetical protein
MAAILILFPFITLVGLVLTLALKFLFPVPLQPPILTEISLPPTLEMTLTLYPLFLISIPTSQFLIETIQMLLVATTILTEVLFQGHSVNPERRQSGVPTMVKHILWPRWVQQDPQAGQVLGQV